MYEIVIYEANQVISGDILLVIESHMYFSTILDFIIIKASLTNNLFLNLYFLNKLHYIFLSHLFYIIYYKNLNNIEMIVI